MENQTVNIENESPEFKRTSVLLTIILSLVTMGIYMPYWFITRRKELNKTESSTKISFEFPLSVLVLYSFSALIYILSFIIPFSLGFWEVMDSLDNIITYYGIAVIIFLSFYSIRILKDHYPSMKYSKLATFFFTIWYVQYKINKL